MRFFSITCFILSMTFVAQAQFTKDSPLDDYIVFLKEGYSMKEIVNKHIGKNDKVRRTYNFGKFVGFSGKISERTRLSLKKDNRVDLIEKNQIFTTAQVYDCPATQNTPEWFLPRISYTDAQPTNYRYPTEAGSNVNAYVLDSGVLPNHSEFEGRVVIGKNFVLSEPHADETGHGTCVASLLGGKLVGVAKKVTIISVKIFNSLSISWTTDIIAAIEYAINDRPGTKKLINLSSSGLYSQAMNKVIAAAVAANIPFFAAAGNENELASNRSPASEGSAITVAASDVNNNRYRKSNYGPAVDIIAPGVDIKCASHTGPNAFTLDTGTSMATPMVAGVGALMLSSTTMSARDIKLKIIEISRPNLIRGFSPATPNRFLYTGCK